MHTSKQLQCTPTKWSVATGTRILHALLLLLLMQVVWHDTLLPQHPLQGRQAAAAVFNWLHAALPDLQLQVGEVVSVEQHHILLYYTAAGTHTGTLHSSFELYSCDDSSQQQQVDAVKPTGNAVSWTGSLVLRMQPDSAAAAAAGAAGMRAAAAWHSWDPLFFYQQVGLNPSTAVPEAPPAAPVAMQDAAAGAAIQAAAAVEGDSKTDARKAVVQQYFNIYNSGEHAKLACQGTLTTAWILKSRSCDSTTRTLSWHLGVTPSEEAAAIPPLSQLA
jgi:hypothetical protein